MLSCENLIKLLYPAVEEQYRSANGHYDTENEPLVSKLTAECYVYTRCLETLGHSVSIEVNFWDSGISDSRIMKIRLDRRTIFDDGRWTNSFWKWFPDADKASEDVVRQRTADLNKALFIMSICRTAGKDAALECYKRADQSYIDSVVDAIEARRPLREDEDVSVEDIIREMNYRVGFISHFEFTFKEGIINPALEGELEGYKKVLALLGHELNVSLDASENLDIVLDGVLLISNEHWTSDFRERCSNATW